MILLRAMQGEELGEVVHLGVVADFFCFVYWAVRCLLIDNDSLQLVLYSISDLCVTISSISCFKENTSQDSHLLYTDFRV